MEDVKIEDIDFIIALKVDNEERQSNVNIQKEFFSNVNIRYIEDSPSEQHFNKCALYNIGAESSQKEYFCFIDSDILIDPQHIVNSINENRDGLTVCYNKKCIYLDFIAKRKIRMDPTIQVVESCIPSEWFDDNGEVNQYNIVKSLGDCRIVRVSSGFVPNNDAIGGCLVMSKECFKDIKGFNTNFKDWGYEDNEILIRAHKLGKNVMSLNNPRAILFHLPHEESIITNNATETLPDNEREVHKIENFTVEELKEYIKNW